MGKLTFAIYSALLATTPAMLVYPQDPEPQIYKQTMPYSWSYDEILHLLEQIESGDLEARCSLEELEQVNRLLAFLAKEGILPDEDEFALDEDIANLLNDSAYMSIPAVWYGDGEVMLCKKSKMRQTFHRAKKFCKKHKKAIIIGAVIVLTVAAVVTVVVLIPPSAAAGAAAAGSALAYSLDSSMATDEFSAPKAVLDRQIPSFKESIMKEQFFQSPVPSWEENGRALGSIFAHDTLQNLEYERRLRGESLFPPQTGHAEIDHKFSTHYAPLYEDRTPDFHALSHQVIGEQSLAYGYYEQAVHSLSRAIEMDPINPLPYLERGVAHFELGQYDRSLEDYHTYTAQKMPLSVSDFSLGFAKGLPKGVYESGEGILLFLTDFVKHPVHTSEQVVESITSLINLVRNDEWGVVAEALSPEVHQLVTQWDVLSSEKRGELAGYAVGKHGADILIPGALVKVASKSAKSAQELAAVCKKIQIAQETLVLETAAGVGSNSKLAEVVCTGKATANLANELGFTARELGKLKQAGQLEEAVAQACERIANDPILRESFERSKDLQNFLKPFQGKYLPEAEIRELLYQYGIPTFPRPANIPVSFRVRISDKGAGMIYVHPEHTHTSIRVMPGKPHSPLPHQQKPYVIYRKNGNTLNKFGNIVEPTAAEAHIPIEEFIFKG